MLVTAVGVVLLKETYAPKLESTGTGPHLQVEKLGLHQTHERINSETNLAVKAPSTAQPLIMSPAVAILSAYTTLSSSYIFLLCATFPDILEQAYPPGSTNTGIAYLGLGTGMGFGLLYLLLTYPYFALLTKVSHSLESLLSMTVPGACVMPIAIFAYGWSLHHQREAVIPIIATAAMGAAHLATFVSTVRLAVLYSADTDRRRCLSRYI